MVKLLGLGVICASVAVAQPSSETVRFKFREPGGLTLHVQKSKLLDASKPQWLKAVSQEERPFEIGSRVVLRCEKSALKNLLDGTPLKLVRTLQPDLFILEAPDAITAAQEAERLASLPEVSACSPVLRRPFQLDGPYAAIPNDPHFVVKPPYTNCQWHLENRNSTNGASTGVDLNVRAAWPYARGQGVTIAFADDGVEYTHPDLVARAEGAPHYNFATATTNGMPASAVDMHGTSAAGVAAAEVNNGTGVAGVAPGAQIAGWKMFSGTSNMLSDEQLMNLFQYASNTVAVQNHSWGSGGDFLRAPGTLTSVGIAHAVQYGREGKGVVVVRSAGNNRANLANANADGMLADSRVIGVAAVRKDGRVASYSNPGACLLVAAPSGDSGFPGVLTTDRAGAEGYNKAANSQYPNCWDYHTNYSGTSAAAPQISGLAALILSANPSLGYRDVQQILIQSSRHYDWADPDITTNGAGFVVSHNLGFGVPDAGLAVELARRWTNRPELTSVSWVASSAKPIPDDGVHVLADGGTNMLIHANPCWGLNPDRPTATLPLVDVGPALTPIALNLTNKGALIQRGTNNFSEKIGYAAAAGASFAIVFNNVGTTERALMGTTDFVPIPAVFIGQNDGLALRNALLSNNVNAQLRLNSADFSFTITNTLICEHIALRLQTDHQCRADLRVTVTSPQGTRSIMQRISYDTSAGPVDWTYVSTHHFYESSRGQWTVSVTDEFSGATGSVLQVALGVSGVEILDTDADGLDDQWELAHFNSLEQRQTDDPDKDGFNNMREQIAGMDPTNSDSPCVLDLSPWNGQLMRLSWPAGESSPFEIRGGNTPDSLAPITQITGQFPVTEYFFPYTNSPARFFQVRALPQP